MPSRTCLSLLDQLDDGVTAVVSNTWSFSYLGRERRQDYVDVLAEASRRRPVAWLMADDGSVLEEVPGLEGGDPGDHALGGVVFERGAASAHAVLAGVHQHGTWIDWRISD